MENNPIVTITMEDGGKIWRSCTPRWRPRACITSSP